MLHFVPIKSSHILYLTKIIVVYFSSPTTLLSGGLKAQFLGLKNILEELKSTCCWFYRGQKHLPLKTIEIKDTEHINTLDITQIGDNIWSAGLFSLPSLSLAFYYSLPFVRLLYTKDVMYTSQDDHVLNHTHGV